MTKNEAIAAPRDPDAEYRMGYEDGKRDALADPLGLLEGKLGKWFKDEVTLRYFDADGGNTIIGLMRGETGDLVWWGGRFDSAGRAVTSIRSRAEAVALLAGKEKG